MKLGGSTGGGGVWGLRCRRRCRVPALPRPVVSVSPAAGDKPQPYIRTAALPPAAGDQRRRYIRTVIVVSLAVGDECRRCWVPALPRPVVGVPPAAGDEPQPYRGRRCRRPVGDEGRRCRGRWLLFRWRLGMSAGGAGFRPSHVRWYGVSPAAGDEPQPYIRSVALPPAGWGRAPAVQGSRPPTSGGRCFAGGGGQAPALQGAALPPAVQGSRPPTSGGRCFAGGAGFPPSHVRWSVFRRRRGTSPSPTLGRWRCRRPVGDEGRRCRGRRCRRRCRVPALPRPVVGVPPAAGDEPQPYRGRRCRRRRGISAGVTGGGGCCFVGGWG